MAEAISFMFIMFILFFEEFHFADYFIGDVHEEFVPILLMGTLLFCEGVLFILDCPLDI
jgi:hypothetical protein